MLGLLSATLASAPALSTMTQAAQLMIFTTVNFMVGSIFAARSFNGRRALDQGSYDERS
jgi:hypothetical protein